MKQEKHISKYEEAIKSVHHAEISVFEAQANGNVEEKQEALMQLQIARKKVMEAMKQADSSDETTRHRLELALQQLHHLEEAEQALDE